MRHTILLLLTINNHTVLIFYVTAYSQVLIVLSTDCLQTYDPDFNWEQGTISPPTQTVSSHICNPPTLIPLHLQHNGLNPGKYSKFVDVLGEDEATALPHQT